MDFFSARQIVLDVKSDCPLGAEELGSALKSVGVLTNALSSNRCAQLVCCTSGYICIMVAVVL